MVSPETQDGCSSLPEPLVNLLGGPVTLPVRGESLIFHRLLVSPPGKEKSTASSVRDQHPGLGRVGTGVRNSMRPAMLAVVSQARVNASCAPVLTAAPPFVE